MAPPNSPTILVVDDTEANRYAVVRHLRHAGYSTREAATAREAREKAREKPDLIILDVKLPDGMGYDVCREIKADASTANIPVLHVSATFRMSSDRIKGLDSGADGFLTGPVEPEELLANVKMLLRLRQATHHLQQSRERLQNVLASITDVYFSLDKEGRFLELNPAAEEVLEASASELIGQTIQQKFPTSAGPLFHDSFQKALRQGTPVHQEEACPSCKRWFEAHAYPRADGVVEFYARDITERKKAEEELRRERDKLSLALSAGQMGAYDFDLVENKFWWSPELYSVFGVSSDAFTPTVDSFSALIHPDDREAFWAHWEKAIRTKTLLLHQFRIVRPDGQIRWIGKRGKTEYDAAGAPLHRFGVAIDITDQKCVEERLERTVAERTAKLREMVGELEAFSYTIAHDMRAPLRSLHGFAEILVQEYSAKLDPEGQGFLRRIAASAGRMDGLIQDVLNYSRIVRAELPCVGVNLGRLLRGILDTYPALAPEKAEILVACELPVVLGNEAMLTQVLSNLLGNAVKFVAPGVRPQIKIWAEGLPPAPADKAWKREHKTVRLFVQDNGIGIPSDQQEKVFAIFQRVDKNYEGTGIGLAIVKKAIERMGGCVGVKSELGQGSTFWIELPLA